MATATAPKILLAKPGAVPGGSSVAKFARSEDESALLRSRLPPLNLLSDSWEFHTDRILPFLTENTDFTVVGVIGPTGAGKSTILNELYGFDSSSPGMLPPFATQSEEMRAMAKHCTTGIELRISAERFILLDTQPVFSPSILAEMMKPDGSSTISIVNGESISADLAHELMTIQVDLLKHAIPDPSLLGPSYTQGINSTQDLQNASEEYSATPVFVHTKLQDRDIYPGKLDLLRKWLSQFFESSSFGKSKLSDVGKTSTDKSNVEMHTSVVADYSLSMLPSKILDDISQAQYASYASSLEELRNKVLGMNRLSFAKVITERDWLSSSSRIWDMVKKSPIIAEYCKTLQNSVMFKR